MEHMAKPKPKLEKVKLAEDAGPRFERFITKVAKAGPQHRVPKPKERPASKGRVHKGKTRS
jgi:hypothetical protein